MLLLELVSTPFFEDKHFDTFLSFFLFNFFSLGFSFLAFFNNGSLTSISSSNHILERLHFGDTYKGNNKTLIYQTLLH